MQKSSTLKSLAVLLLVGLVSFAVWDNAEEDTAAATHRLLPAVTYQTSATRTANVGKYCDANVDRASLVTATEVSTAKSNRKAVDSALGIDGNALINKLANGDTSGGMSMITSNVVNLAIFVGVFLVPFVIFLWVWPFLCCCCCCPGCCPSKCCQHPEGEPYTKCELLWPTVTLILALLLVISASIYGFVTASNVGKSFNSMGCSLAIFTDDLLNGNITANGSSYFTGLNVFSTELTDLSGNLTTIQGYLTDLKNNAAGTTKGDVTKITTVETTYLVPMPTGAITYGSPINVAGPGATVASTFPAKFGDTTTTGTLLYNLFASIELARLSMQTIKDNAQNFDSQVATITAQITPMQTTINDLVTNVQSMDDTLGKYLSYLKTPGSYGNMGMQGFYGFLIAFSFFSLLGVLLMACCDKPGCRHLMYLSCLFLFIGAFIGFFIAIIFSIIVPFFTWTCSYIDVAVGSSAGFSTNFGAFLSASTISKITVCMPYGDGNIVNTVAGTAANGLNNLTALISNLDKFDKTQLEGYISGNLSTLTNTVDDYANGDISDLDSTNNAILEAFSNPSNSTNSAGCTGFSSDSWVPSNAQDTTYSSAVSCKVSSSNQGENSNCDANLAGATCNGCMDTNQLLAKFASAATATTAVNTHYGGGACAFATILGNAWTNYFNVKFTSIGPPTVFAAVTAATLRGRISIATPKINDPADTTSVFYGINEYDGVVQSVKTNLASIQALTDPDYGMLAGLNCKLFGQDFVTFQSVICGSFYNNIYTIRMTFGIACWGILFVLCCSVCAGVRHFKQIDKLKRVSDMGFAKDIESKQDLKGKF